MENNLKIKITKEQIELALGYGLQKFSLHPDYVDGECVGLEIVATPQEPIIRVPVCLFIEKNR